MDNNKLGRKGEKAVAKYLKKNDYIIIYTNYRTASGEIDIIAEKGMYIAFVEVKTRTEGQMLEPNFSVDRKKRRRICASASTYVKKYKIKKQPRFDIAEVIVNDKGKMRINYIDNAFSQEDNDYAVF
ncbi:MAG: YraN family protein [Ruminococcus sp.]|nr:YraN family protein [Ruminococcus sp.]